MRSVVLYRSIQRYQTPPPSEASFSRSPLATSLHYEKQPAAGLLAHPCRVRRGARSRVCGELLRDDRCDLVGHVGVPGVCWGVAIGSEQVRAVDEPARGYRIDENGP